MCGAVYFPPRAECVKCLNAEMSWVDYGGRCNLITYTTVHVAPTGFENMAPYTIGLAELHEGGRVVAWVEDIPKDELKIGMELQVRPKFKDNTVYYVLTKTT